MKIKFRGSLKNNNLVAYITLNNADLKKVDTREAAMLFESLDVNYDNDTICVFIPNIDVKNDIVMRYRVAKEWGLKKCNPTEILAAKKRLGALINRLTVYRELSDVETQAYEECITTRHNGLMWTREIALEEHLEGEIKSCENQKRHHEEALEHYRSLSYRRNGGKGGFMKSYYVLSGNQVLGHFDTLRESWTLDEAVEMAAIDTTQEALERLYMEGATCVHHDDETDCYVFDVYGCRVLDFEPDAGVLELCERIRHSPEWDPVDTCILCELAGLNEEWLNATGEEFKYVVSVAAKELGGVIV